MIEGTRQSTPMTGLSRSASNHAILTAAFCLSACGQTSETTANQLRPGIGERTAPSKAKAFAAEDKTDLFEFDFSWPAEVAAIPLLADRLRGEMSRTRAELFAGAKEEKAFREKEKLAHYPHSSSTVYTTAGQSARLLSLKVEVGGYTGGAHGNYGIAALLWDRRANKEIAFGDLFAAPANRDRLLTPRWCDALNRAREQKRGEPVGGGGIFDDCPALGEIAVIPVDANRDGRFDKLLLAASPYVAGPWAEGAYEIELDVTPELVAGLKAEYRPGFAA